MTNPPTAPSMKQKNQLLLISETHNEGGLNEYLSKNIFGEMTDFEQDAETYKLFL